jgi:hypothetical protein
MLKRRNGQERAADAIGLTMMIGKNATGTVDDSRCTMFRSVLQKMLQNSSFEAS